MSNKNTAWNNSSTVAASLPNLSPTRPPSVRQRVPSGNASPLLFVLDRRARRAGRARRARRARCAARARRAHPAIGHLSPSRCGLQCPPQSL